jgi:hypothetical protein
MVWMIENYSRGGKEMPGEQVVSGLGPMEYAFMPTRQAFVFDDRAVLLTSH